MIEFVKNLIHFIIFFYLEYKELLPKQQQIT